MELIVHMPSPEGQLFLQQQLAAGYAAAVVAQLLHKPGPPEEKAAQLQQILHSLHPDK